MVAILLRPKHQIWNGNAEGEVYLDGKTFDEPACLSILWTTCIQIVDSNVAF